MRDKFKILIVEDDVELLVFMIWKHPAALLD